MKILNKKDIVDAADRKYVTVEVPEWGGAVRIQSLDADQLLRHEEIMQKKNAGGVVKNPMLTILSDSLVDEEGNRQFLTDDLAALGKKSPAVLGRLIKAVVELNKIDKADLPLGNSEAAPNGGSPSDSA